MAHPIFHAGGPSGDGLVGRTKTVAVAARFVDVHLGGQLADQWVPEAAWAPVPFPPPPTLSGPGGPHERLTADDPLEVQEAFEHEGRRPRPSLLLSEPLRIDVSRRSASCASGHGAPNSIHFLSCSISSVVSGSPRGGMRLPGA